MKIPVPARELTWDDLQALPDELHHHYELIEGQILISPSPSRVHQRAVGRLYRALDDAAGEDVETFVAPFDFVPDSTTSLQPDVLVVGRGTEESQRTVVPPVLVIEVLSPSSRTTDRTTKRELYARFGVPHYWIIDPDPPSILALELGPDGAYTESAAVSGDDTFRARKPFVVDLTPAQLITD